MNKKKRKIKRKHLIAMGLIAFVMLLSSPTYALRYDLQPYTACNNGLCSTSLDVSTLGLNTAKINALKTVNITNFLTKSGVINNFQYSWSGNTLTISGRVSENVYWSFGAGGDTYDPWWNYTSLNSTASTFYGGGGAYNDATTHRTGMNVTFKKDLGYIEVIKYNTDTATKFYLYNGTTHALIETATFTGNNASITRFMPAGRYDIMVGKDGASYTRVGTFPFSGYPNSTDVNILWGTSAEYDESSTWTYPTNFWGNIQNLTTRSSSQVNVYYETFLYLNGTQANITLTNTTPLYIIAYNNLTLNSSIYINDILKNNTVSNATYNLSNVSSGLYNITAYFFNASTNSSLTYWANFTYTAPSTSSSGISATVSIDMNAAPLTCLNSTHAVRNSTFINNGTSTPLAELYFCTDGCDNVTNSGCMPPKWQTNLWVLVIVTVIIIALYKVYRWV